MSKLTLEGFDMSEYILNLFYTFQLFLDIEKNMRFLKKTATFQLYHPQFMALVFFTAPTDWRSRPWFRPGHPPESLTDLADPPGIGGWETANIASEAGASGCVYGHPWTGILKKNGLI